MNEDERLYEQYEDAFFALLMNRVAEANGKELMQKNEELLADPNAAIPESLNKRCLHMIEKSYRKARIQKAAKKTLRTLNRVALWIEREAIGMMSDYLNMGQMDAAPRLNGAAPRAKFADVVLPTFPQRRKHTA